MSIFTGTPSEILAVPGGIVLGFGGESLDYQPLNLFLKVQEPDAQNGSLTLHTIGISSGLGKGLTLFIGGQPYGKALNLFISSTLSPSQRNMNLFVEGGGQILSGSMPLYSIRTAEEILGDSLPLYIEAPLFASSLNLILWRVDGLSNALPLIVSGYALEATGSCVLYLEGPVGVDGSVVLVTAGAGVSSNALPLITEGY